MKTILFLETSLRMGGSERMWAELLSRLDPKRFRPILGCLYEAGTLGEQLKGRGVAVYSRLAAHRGDWRAFFRLISLIRRERVDALYMINQPLTQFWGTVCGRLAGVPALVTSIHSTGKINRIQRRLWINRLTFPFVDRVTAVSESHKNYLVVQEGIDPKKIEIIPNGIEVNRFTGKGSPKELRASLGIREDERVIGIVAMLRPEKAHEVFLEAAHRILKVFPNCRFLVVGDGPERPRLEVLTAQLGIAEKVSFLGVRGDVPEIISLFDVGVLSSRSVVETLSVSVLEYLAAGKPVVATRVGSLPELIEEGKNGFLVDSGDSETLAERVLRLLRDPALARAMGAKGRAKVIQEYTVEEMVKRAEALFDELLNHRRMP